VMALLQEASLAANLSALDFHGAFYTWERPVYGLVQRTLFANWCVWCFGTGCWLTLVVRGGPLENLPSSR